VSNALRALQAEKRAKAAREAAAAELLRQRNLAEYPHIFRGVEMGVVLKAGDGGCNAVVGEYTSDEAEARLRNVRWRLRRGAPHGCCDAAVTARGLQITLGDVICQVAGYPVEGLPFGEILVRLIDAPRPLTVHFLRGTWAYVKVCVRASERRVCVCVRHAGAIYHR
jgi:hypothetical protein